MNVAFPKDRFAPGNGRVTMPVDISADLFLRKKAKEDYRFKVIPFDVSPMLNCVGGELWTMVLVARPDDPVFDAARDALAGSVHSYLVLLDLLQEQDVLTEEQIAPSRKAASLWQEGIVNQRLDRQMRRLYGPDFAKKPEPKRIRSAYPTAGGTYVPNFGNVIPPSELPAEWPAGEHRPI